MKKILSLFFIVALSNYAQASGCYIGINLGGGLGSNKLFSQNTTAAGIAVDDTQIDTLSQGHGVLGDIKFGYGHLFNPLYIAIEGLWGATSIQGQHKSSLAIAPNSQQKIEFRLRDTFALNGHIGAQFSSFLAYLITGFSYSYWETEASFKGDPVIVGLPRSNKKGGYLPGLTLGIGTQGKISEKISIGLEYTCTWYNKRFLVVKDVFSVGIPNRDLEVSNKYTLNKVVLGVTYHL